mmetsp:Transcript_34423/g.63761  ORF Transcript_34423/g.63761 Transcript_34423/m.63761 type:complete len:256 (-) Transcript_34423:884-1651(-)
MRTRDYAGARSDECSRRRPTRSATLDVSWRRPMRLASRRGPTLQTARDGGGQKACRRKDHRDEDCQSKPLDCQRAHSNHRNWQCLAERSCRSLCEASSYPFQRFLSGIQSAASLLRPHQQERAAGAWLPRGCRQLRCTSEPHLRGECRQPTQCSPELRQEERAAGPCPCRLLPPPRGAAPLRESAPSALQRGCTAWGLLPSTGGTGEHRKLHNGQVGRAISGSMSRRLQIFGVHCGDAPDATLVAGRHHCASGEL